MSIMHVSCETIFSSSLGSHDMTKTAICVTTIYI